eukprot:3999666-Amphidinium_carterae.1
MACSRPLGLDSCRLMSLHLCRNWVLPLSGLMVRASIAATRTFVAVESVMSPIQERDAGWRYLAYDN